jgi:predicted nuclease of predicted toxin-antitoxin system
MSTISASIWRPDKEMREYAGREGFVIVTKDSDFSDLCILLGFPPKVIWIRRGNCSSRDIESILRDHNSDIEALGRDEVIGILTLFEHNISA